MMKYIELFVSSTSRDHCHHGVLELLFAQHMQFEDLYLYWYLKRKWKRLRYESLDWKVMIKLIRWMKKLFRDTNTLDLYDKKWNYRSLLIDQFHVTAAIMVQRSIGVKNVNIRHCICKHGDAVYSSWQLFMHISSRS